ncbi:MAG: A/G-specific adenine glycosylase [Angelakisella sp.]
MSEQRLLSIVQPLLAWYDQNARVLPWRENTAPYRVWVSEIMLQQTRVEAVIPYYRRFMQELPTIQALADADEELLLKLWEGLGYYTRVRNLQKAAKKICAEYGGEFPADFDAIRSLPGIGDYTAGAISSISFGQPTPGVDGNVLRVVARLTADATDLANASFRVRTATALAEVYPTRCGDFTQSLMELGAVVCLPNGAPKCDSCPLAFCCKAYAQGSQAVLPVKATKKERRQEDKTVLLLCCGDKVALRKRAAGGLLGGLWEFPNLDGLLSPEQAAEWLGTAGLAPCDLRALPAKRHVFTHVEWQMHGYLVQCANRADTFVWVTREELTERIGLPTAFKQFCKLL